MTMPLYATPAELAAWLDPDAETPTVPANATVLLRAATELVRDAASNAVYRTDSTGAAIDSHVSDALRDATTEQASAWSLNGLDPRKGPQQAPRRVASKGLNGASVSYVADSAADTALSELASGKSLTASAWRILDNAGLVSTRVSTGSWGAPRSSIPVSAPFVLDDAEVI